MTKLFKEFETTNPKDVEVLNFIDNMDNIKNNIAQLNSSVSEKQKEIESLNLKNSELEKEIERLKEVIKKHTNMAEG